MKKSEIADIIKEHPEISYEEGWRQALQAGLCRVDFEGAWAAARESKAMDDPDRRIQEILKEMRKSGKKEWALADWKTVFAGKGIDDAECELAFALSRAQKALGPLSTVWMRRMATLLVILSIAFGLWLGGKSEGGSVMGVAWTLFSLIAYVGCFLALGAQFRESAHKLVLHELGVESLNSEEWHSKWKGEGFEFLGNSNATLTHLVRIRHGGRTTYFGEYVHREGKGAYSGAISRFLVAQEVGKPLPGVHCIREWKIPTASFKSPLKTGNEAFERVFTSFSEDASGAVALLSRGAANCLVEKAARESVRSFEAIGDTSILLLAPIPLQTDIRFSGPMVRFSDYQRIKKGILDHLDLAAGIINTL
jgi:hypothetical protein